MSEENTGKTVRFSMDLDTPPPLTAEERSEMERLKAMRDEEIDCSDVSSQAGKGGWARPGLFGGPVGSLRRAAMRENLLLVDAEVVEFFKESGDASADRMNAVLREYVETHRKSA